MKFYKKMILWLSLIIITGTSNTVFALLRGNDIYPACEHVMDKSQSEDFKTPQQTIKNSIQRGYLVGFCYAAVGTAFQGVRGLGYTWSVDSKFAKCMSEYYRFDEINGQQILDMTMKYLKDHPKSRNLEINIILASMLHDEYPSTVCGASTSDEKRKKLIDD